MTRTEALAATPPAPDLMAAFGVALRRHWLKLVLVPLCCGALGLGATFLMKPRFQATTTFLPPQQASQGTASSALAALGTLTGLAGVGGKTPADQYVSLMQSTTVSDRIVDQFKLMQEYDVKYRVQARKRLASNVRIAVGKKDGLISIVVEDTSPQRAADMANQYVAELQQMTNRLAMTEAQQRRMFFERQLKDTRDRLTAAQKDLQASGYSPGALRAEPKAAADGYSRLRAEVVAAEVKLQSLRARLTDTAPEVQQQAAALRALREQLGRDEQPATSGSEPDYVGKYREFKYQEALFEVYARQFELARVDESREGALIQVVDPATPPEVRVFPRPVFTAAVAASAAFVLMLALILFGELRRFAARESQPALAI